MQHRKLRATINCRNLLFIPLIVGVIALASSMPFGTGSTPTEAASPSAPSLALSRRAYLPIAQKSAPPPAPAPTTAYLGAWIPGLPENTSALTSFQNTIGRKIAIVAWYQGWSGRDLLNQTAARTVSNQGSIPMVTWEPWDWTAGVNQPAYSNASIVAGSWDSFITSYAQSVKSYGKPIFLRYAHEMNAPNSGYPWAVGVNGNTAQSYVAAWRHIHDVFARVGATNVLWVWSPIIKYGGTTPFSSIYPGDSYVDWMALDGYNGGTAVSWGWWASFSQLFGPSYQELIGFNQKPIMIAETASAEQGGSKAAWITDALLTQLPRNFPRIKALVWFNENRAWETDWRVNSSSTSLSAYQQAAANSYFKQSMP